MIGWPGEVSVPAVSARQPAERIPGPIDKGNDDAAKHATKKALAC